MRLLKTLPGIEVVPRGAKLKSFDLHCPMLDLAGIFATSVEDLAPAEPYLMAEAGWVTARPLPKAPGALRETAGVVAQVDLVIAVDTSAAHLAAAMGKPVFLLSRFDACWRWLRDRSGSPWYSTVTLFRQPAPHDWQTPIAEIVQRLKS